MKVVFRQCDLNQLSRVWHSSAQPSIICLFELVHLNDLLFDEWFDEVVKKVNVKEALELSIFVVQKAAAPKTAFR